MSSVRWIMGRNGRETKKGIKERVGKRKWMSVIKWGCKEER